MIRVTSSGSFKNTEAFLRKMTSGDIYQSVVSGAEEGVRALAAATPLESGLAADSWNYEIERSGRAVTIRWTNIDVENGFPVAIMLQLGYATGTGGYVQGRDYINPAMKPVFDKIEADVWKAVTSA
jgi:hypothetical protein